MIERQHADGNDFSQHMLPSENHDDINRLTLAVKTKHATDEGVEAFLRNAPTALSLVFSISKS